MDENEDVKNLIKNGGFFIESYKSIGLFFPSDDVCKCKIWR